MQVDASELVAFADDLADRSVRNSQRIAATTIKAGVNIRDAARRNIAGLAHAPHYPRAITYDVEYSGAGGSVTVEVGPDKNRRQGALGNILEYGTANNAPLAHLGPAFDREVPEWLRHVEADAGDL